MKRAAIFLVFGMNNRERALRQQAFRELVKYTMAEKNRSRHDFFARAIGPGAAYLRNKNSVNAMKQMKRAVINRQRDTLALKSGNPTLVMDAIERDADASVLTNKDISRHVNTFCATVRADIHDGTTNYRAIDAQARVITALMRVAPQSASAREVNELVYNSVYYVMVMGLRPAFQKLFEAMVARGVNRSDFGVDAIYIRRFENNGALHDMPYSELWSRVMQVIKALLPETPVDRGVYVQRLLNQLFMEASSDLDDATQVRDLLRLGGTLEPWMLLNYAISQHGGPQMTPLLRLFQLQGIRLPVKYGQDLNARVHNWMKREGLVEEPSRTKKRRAVEVPTPRSTRRRS
jgi:hypothetical protein